MRVLNSVQGAEAAGAEAAGAEAAGAETTELLPAAARRKKCEASRWTGEHDDVASTAGGPRLHVGQWVGADDMAEVDDVAVGGWGLLTWQWAAGGC